MQAPDDALREHLSWLDIPNCPCHHEWRSLGRLYGVSMGNGWVRMNTAPDCPHHAARRALDGDTDART